jgi:hypothetical protein
MKHNTIRILLGLALAVAGAQAQAISINPSTTPQWSGPDLTADPACAPNDARTECSKNPDANDVEGIVGTDVELVEAYKQDAGGGESGSFAGVYDTVFANTALDPEDATITFTGTAGEQIACPECYLLVKDGNQDPIWYIFDLGDWDGMESLVLTGFWPDQGAISHVSIFSGGRAVPGPAPFVLMGIGLLGIGLGRLVKAS